MTTRCPKTGEPLTELPEGFVTYLDRGGRTEGPISSTPIGWFRLWPLAEVYYLNAEYQVSDYAPGLLGFGSDGGGEMLAFDAQNQVVLVPFIGMNLKEARLIAPSWEAFERMLAL
jgi:hypothetical protein